MKNILIDCRYLGMSGIGRFLEGILENLDFSINKYTLIGKKDKIEKYKNCEYIIDNTSPFSIKGILNLKIQKINEYDIFFTPNFIIPYGIKIKVVTVLHDLIFLDMKEVNSGIVETMLKKHLLKRCIKKSNSIFTVSKFSKNRICHYFPKAEGKIIYAYQGVAHHFKDYKKQINKKNYIVYVGNIKKHKGLKVLLKAYENIKDKIDLLIVGDASGFRNSDKESMELIEKLSIKFTGRITDEELLKTIAEAKFLIQPSLYEGFGLPPMEALYLGTKPIISDIEVFKEVYQDLPVIFFENGNFMDLANKILNSATNVEIVKEELNQKFSYFNYAKLIETKF